MVITQAPSARVSLRLGNVNTPITAVVGGKTKARNKAPAPRPTRSRPASTSHACAGEKEPVPSSGRQAAADTPLSSSARHVDPHAVSATHAGTGKDAHGITVAHANSATTSCNVRTSNNEEECDDGDNGLTRRTTRAATCALTTAITATPPPPTTANTRADVSHDVSGVTQESVANPVSAAEDAARVEDSEAFRSRVSEITSFRVYARVRPFIAEELAEMAGQERRSIVEMAGNKTILLDPSDNWSPKAQFAFDGSLWSIPPSHGLVHTFQDTKRQNYATQRDVYETLARHLVPHVFDGYNSCILSYGQTGSGKTYTMMGRYQPHACCGGDGEEGIIPRVSSDLFRLLAERQAAAPAVRFRVEVSFVEIYKEKVRDLLDPALRHVHRPDAKSSHYSPGAGGNAASMLHDARIRQDPYSGPFVEGVTKYEVEDWAQCCLLLERGSRHRTTCATAVHNQSSRSHAIYQMTVLQETVVPTSDRYARETVRTKAGRINLVDLAGSERGGFQTYVKESSAINTSLLALRRVIDNLTERQNILMEQLRAEIVHSNHNSTHAMFSVHDAPVWERPLPQVPFRDSVLTWLLSDSIGGNARTTMVATLSPLVKNYADTLATLQWSSRARQLVTFVKMNHEAVSQGGMQSELCALGGAVQVQRGNLDNLRETLRERQAAAEGLAAATAARRRRAAALRQTAHTHRCEAAAFVLQRLARRGRQGARLAHWAHERRQTSAQRAAAAARQRACATAYEAAAAALAQASQRCEALGARAAESRERVRVLREEEQPLLRQRLAEKQARKADVCELVGATALCAAAVSAREGALAESRAAANEARERQAAVAAQRAQRTAVVSRRGTAELRAAVAEATAALPSCRQACEAGRARWEEVKMQRDAVRMRYNKLMRKSGTCGC